VAALELAAGNKTAAAVSLGISRRTLYNKLAEHGLLDSRD
jgi:DNA-binding protein Fis